MRSTSGHLVITNVTRSLGSREGRLSPILNTTLIHNAVDPLFALYRSDECARHGPIKCNQEGHPRKEDSMTV